MELVKLQDAAPAFPLATASIGQVHAATLSDGTEVVVKIRLFWTKRIEQAGLDAAWLGVELPQQLRRLLQTLERGEMQMNVQPVRVEPLMHRLEQISNRIVLGILAAAFINGLAILISVYHPAGWRQWAGPLFAFGFFLALALGVVIAWGILRSRRL